MNSTVSRFPYVLLKRARRLTDQQLWMLGCDVRQTDFSLGSLGWEYHPRPDKTRGCGRLCRTLSGGGHLSVWGFGFLAADAAHGAIWLDRKHFRLRRGDGFDLNRQIWELNHVPAFQAPADEEEADASLFLLARLARTMAEYETDVAALAGRNYRHRCLAGWKFQRLGIPPEEVPGDWNQIASTALELRSPLETRV